jgi:hypothetical protein
MEEPRKPVIRRKKKEPEPAMYPSPPPPNYAVIDGRKTKYYPGNRYYKEIIH